MFTEIQKSLFCVDSDLNSDEKVRKNVLGRGHSLKHHCLLWRFLGGLKTGFFAELPFLTSWENICWLIFKFTLMALCLNVVSQFFVQSIIFSRSLWIQAHLDLGKSPSFIFALDLLSHARVFVSVLRDVQALGVLSIPPRHLDIDSGSCITGFPWKNPMLSLWAGMLREAGPRARPPGQAKSPVRCRVNASALV